MTVGINVSLQNRQADSWGGDLDLGFIDIYDGTQPADPDDPPAGTLLVSCALTADAYAAAVAGVASKNGTITGTAVANGTADYAQMRNAGNTRWMYAPCSLTPGAGVVSLDNLTIAINDVVSINTSTITQPATN